MAGLEIYDGDEFVGELVAIFNPQYDELSKMAHWRKNNQYAFCDDHEITVAGTKKWWMRHVKNNSNRVLYWVINKEGKKIGHMGFDNIIGDSCDIDNVLRGETDSRGLMHLALARLIDFAKKNMKMKDIYLKTRYDNKHAIRFYKKNGFVVYETDKPLITMKYENSS